MKQSILSIVLAVASFAVLPDGAIGQPAAPPTTAPAELPADVHTLTRQGDSDIRRIPALMSPEADFLDSDVPEITRLMNAHNFVQNSIPGIALEGHCSWPWLNGRPRPFKLEFDREKKHAHVRCSQETCTIERDNVITSHRTGGAMQIDALFALAFRTYNAADFNSLVKANLERNDIDGQMRSIPVTQISSQSESLFFDEKSGRLLRAEFRTSRGNIIADFDDYAEVGAKKHMLATSIRLQVPAFLYEGSQVRLPNTGGDALLQIDPTKVQIKERG